MLKVDCDTPGIGKGIELYYLNRAAILYEVTKTIEGQIPPGKQIRIENNDRVYLNKL